MASLIGGIIALIIGLIFFIFSIDSFWLVLKGTVPILLILGGALAGYLGLEEVKDKTTSSDNTDDEKTELKNEVETLKEEIRELKSEKEKTDEEDSE